MKCLDIQCILKQLLRNLGKVGAMNTKSKILCWIPNKSLSAIQTTYTAVHHKSLSQKRTQNQNMLIDSFKQWQTWFGLKAVSVSYTYTKSIYERPHMCIGYQLRPWHGKGVPRLQISAYQNLFTLAIFAIVLVKQLANIGSFPYCLATSSTNLSMENQVFAYKCI